MAVGDQTLTVRRGEDVVIPFAPPSPVDITGYSLAFNVSPSPGESITSGFPLTIGAGITVTDAEAGEYRVTIPKAVTMLLTSGGPYAWDCWRTTTGGEKRLAGGRLVVKEPVRRPAATPPPVPVSATTITDATFAVTFDRDVTASTATGWSVAVLDRPLVTIDALTSVLGATLKFSVTGGAFLAGDTATVSYDGAGDVAGTPDGAPVAAFDEFPVFIDL